MKPLLDLPKLVVAVPIWDGEDFAVGSKGQREDFVGVAFEVSLRTQAGGGMSTAVRKYRFRDCQ